MPLKTILSSGNGVDRAAYVCKGRSEYYPGLMVYTEPIRTVAPSTSIFFNSDNGTDMTVDSSANGVAENIHDGGDTAYWTASTLSGTSWDFADIANPNNGINCISVTSANNGDAALFEDVTTTDFTGYATFNGAVQLETYDGGRHNVEFVFRNSGTNVGNSVFLNTYIDTGIINSYQNFQIPKADFGLSTQTIDELVITITRTTGNKPSLRFDDLKIEQSGGTTTYVADAVHGKIFHVHAINIIIADASSSAVITAYPTLPGLSYNQILGTAALTNGINLIWSQNGVIKYSANIKQLTDFFFAGFELTSAVSDGSNTAIQLKLNLDEPFELDFRTEDQMKIEINDDLSALLEMRACVLGTEEILSEVMC